jgi:hypothetical protein
VAFKPHQGKQVTAAILRAVISRVFEDFRYVRTIDDIGGREHVLMFTAHIGDTTVYGCDIVHLDDDGLIDDFTVMVRPLSAARALSERIASNSPPR